MKHFILVMGTFFVICSLLAVTPALSAEPFPSQSIQLIVPMAPGDATDIIARAVAEELAKILKVPVIINNKPGGATTVGTDLVAKSKKDGYTLLYGLSSGFIYSPAFNPGETPYDPVRDLEPLGQHMFVPTVFSVSAGAPWKNFNEMIEYAKSNPGKFRVGTPGVGSTNHFQLEVIKSLTGADFNMVPFKGGSPAIAAALGGHIEASFVALSISMPHYESGKLRGILLANKVPDLPDIPTLPQLGYKRDLPPTMTAFFAPAGIPEEAKKVLVPAIEKATRNPELITKFQKQWFCITDYKSPSEFKPLMIEWYEDAKGIVKKMGLTK